MRKNLILISSYLPNLKKEVFYYNEFVKIAPSFKKVVLIYHNELPETVKIKVDFKTYIVKYLPSRIETLMGFRFIFNPIVFKEISYLLQNGKFNVRKLISLIGSFSSAIKILKKLERTITENSLSIYDTSILSYWCNNEAIALALLKIKFPNLLCSTRAHRYDVYEEANTLNYLPLRNLIFGSLNNVIFVSRDGLSYSNKKYGNYLSYKLIRIGVTGGKKQLGVNNSDTLLIVSCSNLIKVKRVDRIIDVLSEMNHKMVTWIHFGDGPLKEELMDYASLKLGNEYSIGYEFWGEVSNDLILDFYVSNRITCFINLSESEGIPVSIMEAMASGIPVIATNVGGNSEIVNSGSNGFLINYNVLDQSTIVEMIQKIKESHVVFSANALRTWQEKFNINENTKILIKLIS